MKRLITKTLKITGIILLLLVLFAFSAPILFKRKIVSIVKKEINQNVNATVDFRDVNISFFRHFPRVSLKLEDLSVTGTGYFDKDTLISAEGLDVSVNLFSFFRGSDMKVHAVDIASPRMHLLVNKEGKANWDIAKESSSSETDTSGSSFKISLENYSIEDGYLYYRDETADMTAELTGLDHEGSGDLMADQFVLSTRTTAEAAYFNYAGIPYLSGNKTSIVSDIEADIPNNKYGFKKADIRVNNLSVNADGFFQLENDSTYNMDITFSAPSTEFKEILSLVPAVYKNDFDKIKTSGSALFNGFVKGQYSPARLPAYDVNLEVKDGFFQYPDLPKPVKNIQLALHAANPDGLPDHAVVDISKGHIEMDNQPFDFKLVYKNPETVQYLDAIVKGRIDLADVTKFVKLDKDTKLAGLIDADAFAKGNMAALENQKGPFTAGGFFDIRNLFYSSKDFPQPVQHGNIKAEIVNKGGIADNTSINISSGHIELGNDPFDFSLRLSNPVSSVNFDGNAKGRFTLDNVKQFTKLEEGTSLSGMLNGALQFSGNKSMIDKAEYDKINLQGNAALSDLKYISRDYPTGVEIRSTKLDFSPKNITLKNLEGQYLGTRFSAEGYMNNLIGYMMNKQTLSGTLNVVADKMNLNDWMGTEESPDSASTPADPFLVPAGINLTINAKAGDVKYDKVNYKNISGSLLIADETVQLKNIRTNALEGDITFNGSYSTRLNKKDPDISISYDINDIDIQKAFFAFNTIQKLMPIGQFLGGRLSSELSMTGNLNGNMMPILNSLTGKGNLLLIEGVLTKFKPLEKIASTLNISELSGITVKDIKNYIEFANGKVLVKPFTVKVKDIEMEIGGLHGIDQSMDYIVQMKVPRKYLGTQGNNLVNELASKANAKGIPVQLGETVDLALKLTGNINNPVVKTELKETAGDAAEQLKDQAKEFAQQKIDSAKATVKDSLNTFKKEVTNELKDEIKKQFFSKDTASADTTKTKSLDDTRKKAEQTLKNTMNKLLNKKKKTEPDSTNN